MSGGNRKRGGGRRLLQYEWLEPRHLLSGSPWQNPLAYDDVNTDGTVSPADALLAINAINAGMGGALFDLLTAPTMAASTTERQYVDTNGDGQLSPADALAVINAINSGQVTDGPSDDDVPAGDQQPASGVNLYTGMVPSIYWTFGGGAIVGQPATIQFSSNDGYSPTYSIASGPAGATIDAASGLLSWVPSSADAPTARFVVRAAEAWGTLVMTIDVPVSI